LTPLALAAVVAALAGGPPQVVHPDGRVGQFRIGVTTRVQLVAALGKPRTTVDAVPTVGGTRTGVRLAYSCGTNCDTVYSFSDETGTLTDFATGSPAVTTERGSHVGLTAARAAKLEGKRLVPGCAAAKVIRVRWDATHKLVVSTLQGRVTALAYLGPHSTYLKPFC
jgi:hypothetical protein